MTMISWVGITRWKCHIGFETINNISFSVSLPLFVPQHMQTHSIFRDRDRFRDTRTNRDTETETNTDTQRIYSRTRHTRSNQHHTRKRTNACCTTKVERTERRAVGNALPRQNYTALGAHVTVYLPTKTHQYTWGTSDCTVHYKYLLFHLHATSVLASAAQAACPYASCHRCLQPHTTIVTFCSLLDVTLSHTNKHASPSTLLSICVQEYVSVYVLPRTHTHTHTPSLSLSFSLSLPPSLGLSPSLAMFIREHTHTPKHFPLFCLCSHKCTHASNV